MANIKVPDGGFYVDDTSFSVTGKTLGIVSGAIPMTAATTSIVGGVKQSAAVAEAAGANVTAAEFKALLDALKAAGIMSTT